MDKLAQAILYYDTESIIYASDGVNDSPLGNFLGELTDELDEATITLLYLVSYLHTHIYTICIYI